jgi:glutathione S-transferase
MDITLYEFGPSRSKKVRWALQELELEFESIEGRHLLHSDELKKIHPLGKLPAVIIDGKPLFEASAICTYLADLAPEMGLISPSGTRARAIHDQWVSFCLTELEAHLWCNSRNTFVLPEEKRLPAIFEQNNEAFCQAASVLEVELGNRNYLVEDRFSVTDIIVGFALKWGQSQQLLENMPNLLAYIHRLVDRTHCTL